MKKVYVVMDKGGCVYSVGSSWRTAYVMLMNLLSDLGVTITEVHHDEIFDSFKTFYAETGETDEFTIDCYEVDDPIFLGATIE